MQEITSCHRLEQGGNNSHRDTEHVVCFAVITQDCEHVVAHHCQHDEYNEALNGCPGTCWNNRAVVRGGGAAGAVDGSVLTKIRTLACNSLVRILTELPLTVVMLPCSLPIYILKIYLKNYYLLLISALSHMQSHHVLLLFFVTTSLFSFSQHSYLYMHINKLIR